MIPIGKIGIWFNHNPMPIKESAAFSQKVEACGYGALWINEAIGRDPFSHLGYLAGQTSKIVLSTIGGPTVGVAGAEADGGRSYCVLPAHPAAPRMLLG